MIHTVKRVPIAILARGDRRAGPRDRPAAAQAKTSFIRIAGFDAPGTPAKYDRVGILEIRSPSAKNILVLNPGTSASAAYFAPLAAHLRVPGGAGQHARARRDAHAGPPVAHPARQPDPDRPPHDLRAQRPELGDPGTQRQPQGARAVPGRGRKGLTQAASGTASAAGARLTSSAAVPIAPMPASAAAASSPWCSP